MIMRQFTKCEKCEHNKICMYEKSAKEILDKTEKYLDTNYVCIPSIFEFSFECKEFKHT